MKQIFVLSIMLLCLPAISNAQGWYIPSGYQSVPEAPGDNVTFYSNNYYLFGITYGDHIALGQNGGTPYNIYESNFRLVIPGSGQIVICEAIPNPSSAVISYAYSSSIVTFANTSVAGNAGSQVQFSASSTSGSFITDSPTFYQKTSIESWFSSAGVNGSNATYRFNIPSNASPGDYAFYIKVKLSSNAAYMAQLTITVSPAPAPQSVQVVSPNGGENWQVGSVHTVSWTKSSGVELSLLYYSTDGGNSFNFIQGVSGTTYDWTIPNTPSTQCKFEVIGRDDAGTFSVYDLSDQVFAIVPAAPPPPTLTSPSNGATGVSTSPTLNWNVSTGASSYRLQVSTSSSFSSIVFDQSNLTSTSRLVSGLSNNTTYYWQVNGTNAGGTSSWSSVWSFTTAAIQYIISTSSNPSNGGTTAGGGTVNSGTLVTVTATPNSGYQFVNWTEGGIPVSTSSSYQFTAGANRALVANFQTTVIQYTISTSSNPMNGGTTAGGGTVNSETSVTVTATPSSGFQFVNWTENGNVMSTSASYTFAVTGNRVLVANFQVSQPSGPFAYYPFNGNASDASGTGNNGTVIGATLTTDRFGNPNSAYSFNGSSNYILVNNSVSFPTNAITTAFWFNRSGTLPKGLENYISKDGAFSTYLYTDSMMASQVWKGSPGVWSWWPSGSYKVNSDANWVFYASTYDNNSRVARIYFNGALVNTINESDPNAIVRASTSALYIGRNGSSSVYFINGKLDDIRIYGRALSSTEIDSLYHEGGWPKGAPVVATQAAYGITTTSATVAGTVNPNGLNTTYYFEYGTTTSYGTQTSITSAGSGASVLNVNAALSGLTPGTLYHYRVAATNSAGTTPGSDMTFISTTNIPTDLAQVTGGTFQMGSSDPNDYGASPPHSITLGSFSMDRTEITYERWTDVRNWGLTHGYTDLPVGRNGNNGTTNHPVTEVNWYDVVKWCNARSEKEGLTPVYYTSNTLSTVYRTSDLDLAADAVKWTANGYRLPTEAEWEFAAKGGTKSHGYIYSGSNNIDDVAWYTSNSNNNTHPVASKGANELGLYDMSGNVMKWCWDWYGAYGVSAQVDPKGPTSGTLRVTRGGAFNNLVFDCRVASRNGYPTNSRKYFGGGFRCVQGNGAIVQIPPTVSTMAATSVTSNSATLNGSVNPNGLNTTYYFEYGTTTSYGTQTSITSAGSGASVLNVNAALSGLTAGTLYHYRVAATNSAGTTPGTDMTFTTGQPTPGTPFGIIAPTSVSSGQDFTVDLQIGTSSVPVSNLKIISFELTYTNTAIIDYTSYEVGDFLTGAQATVVADDANGKVSASVYRTSGGNSGSGLILRLKFKILSPAIDGQQISFGFNTVQANGADGSSIAVSPTPATTQVSTSFNVWPGDADNNGAVNIFDINAIVALNWGKSGPARVDQGMAWKASRATPWSPTSATYADCNGDGAVNIFDINAIVVNFGQSHTLGKQVPEPQPTISSTLVDPPIVVNGPSQVNPNQEFWLEIQVGSVTVPVTNAKIVSLELLYTNTAIIDYVSDELGVFFTGAQKTVVADDANGKISASVYRTSGSNSGYGTILRIKFKVSSLATHGQSIAFSFGGIQANRDDGSTQTLSPSGTTISITTTTSAESPSATPKEFSLGQNYPNPFNPSTTISYWLPERASVQLKITNAFGQAIRTFSENEKEPGRYSLVWDGRDNLGRTVASGTYFYQIRCGDYVQAKKMLLLK